jgi:hypothetical protein
MALRTSPRFALLLLFQHLIAGIMIYVTDLPSAARLAIILLIVLSLIYYLARDVFLFSPDSWQEITLDKREISVVVRDGSSFLAQVMNTTLVSPFASYCASDWKGVTR